MLGILSNLNQFFLCLPIIITIGFDGGGCSIGNQETQFCLYLYCIKMPEAGFDPATFRL